MIFLSQPSNIRITGVYHVGLYICLSALKEILIDISSPDILFVSKYLNAFSLISHLETFDIKQFSPF